ncbi:MAG: hypothetical protein ABUM51_05780, partial [Bacteroidota bacterium]
GKYKAELIDSSRQPVVSICGSIPGAVLIPVRQHWITVLNHKGYLSPPSFGIGSLSVGDEFFQSGRPAGEEVSPGETGKTIPEASGKEEWAGSKMTATDDGPADDILRPDPWQERFTLTINHHP